MQHSLETGRRWTTPAPIYHAGATAITQPAGHCKNMMDIWRGINEGVPEKTKSLRTYDTSTSIFCAHVRLPTMVNYRLLWCAAYMYYTCPEKKIIKIDRLLYLQLTKWRQHLHYISVSTCAPHVGAYTRVLCSNYVTFFRVKLTRNVCTVHVGWCGYVTIMVTLFHAHFTLIRHNGVAIFSLK